MQKLIRPPQTLPDHDTREDACKIRDALNQAGYDASLEHIEWAWGEHSEDYACGWFHIFDFDGAVPILLRYLTPENPPNATP